MPSPTLSQLAMPTVRGTTAVIFTVADPIAQVKAPQVLNHVFASLGVDAVVVPVQAQAARFEPFLRGVLGAQNVRGMLVSIPHKIALMQLLDRPDAASRLAGSANAVRLGADGSIEGALFDGAGFVHALRHQGVVFAGRRVQLVGAGGAGLAIAGALLGVEAPPAELTVCDTDLDRARKLVEKLQQNTPLHTRMTATSHCEPAGFELLINATPLGLNPDDPLPFAPERIERHATVVDILMKDRPTALERACRSRGIAVFTGHEMLLQQLPDYLDFFGFREQADLLRSADHPLMNTLRRTLLGDRHGAGSPQH